MIEPDVEELTAEDIQLLEGGVAGTAQGEKCLRIIRALQARAENAVALADGADLRASGWEATAKRDHEHAKQAEAECRKLREAVQLVERERNEYAGGEPVKPFTRFAHRPGLGLVADPTGEWVRFDDTLQPVRFEGLNEQESVHVAVCLAEQGERIAELTRERDEARGAYLDWTDGVTGEAVQQLRDIAERGHAPEEVWAALRKAMHFYDLTRQAWQGCREEYTELQAELERRTAWSNEQVREAHGRAAGAEAELATVCEERDHIQGLLDTARQVEIERDDLRICVGDAEATLQLTVEELDEARQREADLKNDLRRYEPSDGMMYRLLEYTTRLQEADDLLTELRVWAAADLPANAVETGRGPIFELMRRVDAWHQRHLAKVGRSDTTHWFEAIRDAARLLAADRITTKAWQEQAETWLARPVVLVARKQAGE